MSNEDECTDKWCMCGWSVKEKGKVSSGRSLGVVVLVWFFFPIRTCEVGVEGRQTEAEKKRNTDCSNTQSCRRNQGWAGSSVSETLLKLFDSPPPALPRPFSRFSALFLGPLSVERQRLVVFLLLVVFFVCLFFCERVAAYVQSCRVNQ